MTTPFKSVSGVRAPSQIESAIDWCHDTQHNDTQHNDTQHNDTQH
jgi:hypothetical protein